MSARGGTAALLPRARESTGLDPEAVERLIEEGIEDASAQVSHPRGEHDDDHLAATVVSPTFEGVPLVQQHQLVYDALGEHMTTDIHALELSTYTPEEYDALD